MKSLLCTATFQLPRRVMKKDTPAFVNNIENATVFAKEGEVVWQCRNCGFIFTGKEAPEVCPACLHPQAYFEVKKENY